MNTETLARDYHCSITADVTAKEAFEKIARVSDWWAVNFEGSAERTGDTFTVRFGETFVIFKIGEAIPNKKIVWQVMDCNLHWQQDKKEWNGTEIVWEISSVNGSTRIDMIHVGLVPGVECYENCETGWNYHIKESLFKFLTEDKGLPQE
ncbi:MAG: SRPBCC domain-containing protein [Chitinophagaceae bacterium]|nr:SRPBCC domain-containing protein [Chitinophagaceae bacterium]